MNGKQTKKENTVTTADKIDNLIYDLNWYQRNFEAEQAKFIERVQLNPANAVEWADNVIAAQGWYEASMHLMQAIEDLGAPTADEIRAEEIMALVANHIAELERQIRREHGTSTSGYSNAVAYSKHMSVVRVLEKLEAWVKYAEKN